MGRMISYFGNALRRTVYGGLQQVLGGFKTDSQPMRRAFAQKGKTPEQEQRHFRTLQDGMILLATVVNTVDENVGGGGQWWLTSAAYHD